MKIGIGLPNTVKGVPGRRLVEWAQRAEERGFAGLSTVDRVAYPSHDSLTTLAAAAGATSRIELVTNVLLAPAYPPVLVAKAAATIDRISGGRFTLGLAPGGRSDDYVLTGRDFGRRGRNFDAALDLFRRAWAGEVIEGSQGEPVTPPPTHGRVPILVGGYVETAIARAARWADGFTIGNEPSADSRAVVEQVQAAWKEAGREGEPRIAAMAYYSLGPDATADSDAYLRDYYAFIPKFVDHIAAGALHTPEAIRSEVDGYAQAGVTELYLGPTTAALEQLDRLADLVL